MLLAVAFAGEEPAGLPEFYKTRVDVTDQNRTCAVREGHGRAFWSDDGGVGLPGSCERDVKITND